MKIIRIYHPLLFALYPVLFLYATNIREVSIQETLLPIGIILGWLLCIDWLLKFFLHNSYKRGLLISLTLILFFSYGHILEYLRGDNIDSFFLSGYFIAPFLILIYIIAGFAVVRTQSQLVSLTRFMNFFGGVLIILSIMEIVYFSISFNTKKPPIVNSLVSDGSENVLAKPDIYYLIFDRYGRSDVLKEVYDFDNSDFIKYLESRGFYVADKSTSNYLKTGHSLASSLNMKYLDSLEVENGRESESFLPLYTLLQKHEVGQFLKKSGYLYLHFGSFWAHTSRNLYADDNFNLYPVPEFSMLLLKTTLLYPGFIKHNSIDDHKLQWERVQFQFAKIKEIAGNSEPTFVFAHFLIPHDPFVFGADGHFQTRREQLSLSYRDGYVGQVIYLNNQIRELVDTILVESKIPPIIVIQSDEGIFPKRYLDRQLEHVDDFNWEEASDWELMQKMAILNAVYMPGAEVGEKLYDTITPVNTFRLIFNEYFATHFEALPDKNYIFRDDLHPYTFTDKTDVIKNQNTIVN